MRKITLGTVHPRPGRDRSTPPDFSKETKDRFGDKVVSPDAELQVGEYVKAEDIGRSVEYFYVLRFGQHVEIVTRDDRRHSYHRDITLRVNGHTVLDMSYNDAIELKKRLDVALGTAH